MPSNRRTIERPRRTRISAEALRLFVALENTPSRRRHSQEFKDGSKRLAVMLGLTAEWWAMCHVEDADKPRPREGLVAHDDWLTVRRVREALLAASGLADVAARGKPLAKPAPQLVQ
jgi:hypothetical protein